MNLSRPLPIRRVAAFIAAGAALCGVLAGCGTSSSASSGVVNVSGSTTLLPFIGKVASEFASSNTLAQFAVQMAGTSDGFSQLCNGLTDIAGASSKMSATSAALCHDNGISYVRLTVANDAIVVFTSPARHLPQCLTMSDLYALSGPESVGYTRWSDATRLARTLGSPTQLPNVPLRVFGPQTGQGTLTSYQNLVIAPIAARRGRSALIRLDYTSEPSNDIMRNVVLQSPDAFAFLGYSTVAPWGTTVRPFAIDAGKGCQLPGPTEIAAGSYPLSRQLYIYVNMNRVRSNATARAFVSYLVGGDVLQRAGAATAIAASSAQISASQSAWASALSGSTGASQ